MRVRKRTLKIIGLCTLAVLLILIFWRQPTNDGDSAGLDPLKKINITKDTIFMNRELPKINIQLNNTEDDLEIYNISFKTLPFVGFDTTIHGLLFKPKMSVAQAPGVVLLPGGGVTKETEGKVARIIARPGYVVLTIDQRGIGETGGFYVNFDQDAMYYMQGQTPVQHLSVFDALLSVDVLGSLDYVDEDRIVLAGESMGGRYALIAGGIDGKVMKGIIGISTAGFHIVPQGMPADAYFHSIDPDNYVSMIAPNPLIMIHGTNDTMVPIESANFTFTKAGSPKRFYITEGCEHGYCDEMKEPLLSELKSILYE